MYMDRIVPPGQGDLRNDIGAYGGPGNAGWLPPNLPDFMNHVLGKDGANTGGASVLDLNGSGAVDVSDLILQYYPRKK